MSSEAEEVYISYERKDEILNNNGLQFMNALEVTPELMLVLVQRDVITQNHSTDILAIGQPSRQKFELIDHLHHCSIIQFVEFCITLHNDMHRPDVVKDVFKLDINQLYKQKALKLGTTAVSTPDICIGHYKQHFVMDGKTGEKQIIPAKEITAILVHCEAAERNLMKGSLFGFHDDVALDLTELYIEPDPEHIKQIKGKEKRVKIKTSDMLSQLTDKQAPCTALLEGDAGTGKSSVVESITYNWCREFLECQKRTKPCQGHTWKLIIHVKARDIDSNVDNAIRENIHGGEHAVNTLFPLIKQGGIVEQNTALYLDGIDEVLHQSCQIIIKKYVEAQKRTHTPKLLVSSRKQQSCIERKEFDRRISLEGFSTTQGIHYIVNYFDKRFSILDHEILAYVKSHTEKLHWLLCNPLRMHIFSELSGQGKLTLDDLKTLTMAKLLKVLEKFVLRYDEGKSNDLVPDSRDFYMLCLTCLLRKEEWIAVDVFPKKTARMVFLSKRKELTLFAEDQSYFKFTHRMFYEYFCSQGIVEYLKANDEICQKALLLHLSIDCLMWNTLLMTCEYIAVFEADLLPCITFIVQASLILQTEKHIPPMNELTKYKYDHLMRFCQIVGCFSEDNLYELAQLENEMKSSKGKLIKSLLELPQKISGTICANDILEGLNAKYPLVCDFLQTISSAFGENSEMLKNAGWIKNNFKGPAYIEPSPILDFAIACIQNCSKGQQISICKQSTHRLLPAIWDILPLDSKQSRRNYVIDVGDQRWAALSDGGTQQLIWIWSIRDLCLILNLHGDLTASSQSAGPLCNPSIDLEAYSSRWGSPPAETMTVDYWIHALPFLKDALSVVIKAATMTPLDGLLLALHSVFPHGKPEMSLFVINGLFTPKALLVFERWLVAVSAQYEILVTISFPTISVENASDVAFYLFEKQSIVYPSERYVCPPFQSLSFVTIKGEYINTREWSLLFRLLHGIHLLMDDFVDILMTVCETVTSTDEPYLGTCISSDFQHKEERSPEVVNNLVKEVLRMLSAEQYSRLQDWLNKKWVMRSPKIDHLTNKEWLQCSVNLCD